MTKKCVIIHGTKGSPEDNWLPWLSKELTNLGWGCHSPKMPTPEGQDLENWIRLFERNVVILPESSLLVGHSVGAVFVLRILERLSVPIHHAIVVSGLIGPIGLPEYDQLNSSFVTNPFDWTKIRANAKKISCIFGEQDPYIPLDQSLLLSHNLGVNPIRVPHGGHLNAEFGFYTLPILLDLVKD